jgi:hypothetical protein
MRYRNRLGTLGFALLSTGWLLSTNLHAASDGYSIEDFRLGTGGDLVRVCTVDAGHEHREIAKAFCYGFFEGATHYDDAISGSEWYQDIVCAPDDATREQAVTVFIEYINVNPQHGSEPPIDAIFRALVDEWPCAE